MLVFFFELCNLLLNKNHSLNIPIKMFNQLTKMRLAHKIILIIVITVTVIISALFYTLGIHFDNQIETHLLKTARSIYTNIVLIRQWVSDHEGIFILKRNGEKANPFLPHPELVTTDGDTLMLRNPAMVTRELSELSTEMGDQVRFHLTSLRYLNPGNKPDAFEKQALLFFQDSLNTEQQIEFYQTETINNKDYFRYFAPLYTEQSCLSCHSKQGYEVGDLRGGISILIPIDEHRKAKKTHLLFFGLTGLVAILALSIPMYFAIKRSVIKPLGEIEQAARHIESGDYDFELNWENNDEIGNLATSFDKMRRRIKEYTTQLKDSENKYRQLSEYSFDAVVIINNQHKIIYANSKFLHMTGCSDSEIGQLDFRDIIIDGKKQQLSTIGNDDMAEHYESLLSTSDNLEIPVEIYKIKGFSLGDEQDLTFVYIRDLSERKKIEAYSIQTEKMFALGQISAGIAHEIRNPIFAINNNLGYLKNKYYSDEEFQELYPEFKQSIERIQNLVSAILDYARPHEMSLRDVDIRKVVERSLILVEKQLEKSSIRIITEFEHNNKKIRADSHKLEQVFVNLFLNAFQAMPVKGILTIRTRDEGTHLAVEIEDTGKGIPHEDLKRVFDPFYTKTANGTGLGMSIVQRILDQHNAHYWIKSEVGLGTIFHILFHYGQEQRS